MSFFGLDIGSSSFKVAKLTPLGGVFMVNGIGATTNPAYTADLSDPTAKQKAVDSVKKLLSDMKMKERRVVVGIPESRVYSRVLTLPIMSDVELESAMKWEAEQFVPVPISEVELDYSMIRRGDGDKGASTMLVYLIASSKKYLTSVVDFVTSVGLEPIAIESEMVAITRVIAYSKLQGSSMILHVGSSATLIGIVENESLLFAYVVPVGGVAMTRALSQALTFTLPQAEEYKRTYGLDGRQFEGKVKNVLVGVVSSLLVEIHKALEYHATQHKMRIGRMILSGGGAYLPELSAYLSGEFPGIEVVVMDPFAKAKLAGSMKLPVDRASYAVATGLALREQ